MENYYRAKAGGLRVQRIVRHQIILVRVEIDIMLLNGAYVVEKFLCDEIFVLAWEFELFR